MKQRLNYARINKRIARHDPSLIGASQIVMTRKRWRKKAPDWVMDDVKIRKLLLRVFPKLHIDAGQRIRAARWAAIIRMYYSSGMTETDIAQEIGGTPNAIRQTRKRVLWAYGGLAANSGKPLKRKRTVTPYIPFIEADKDRDVGTSKPV